jgi:hypothetical protein
MENMDDDCVDVRHCGLALRESREDYRPTSGGVPVRLEWPLCGNRTWEWAGSWRCQGDSGNWVPLDAARQGLRTAIAKCDGCGRDN